MTLTLTGNSSTESGLSRCARMPTAGDARRRGRVDCGEPAPALRSSRSPWARSCSAAFRSPGAEDFDRFVAAFDLPNFPYEDSLSNAVRVIKTPRVFTANEAPPTVTIFLHHEMAQTPIYPSKLFFFCEQPAETGGATPLCRSDVLWERLRAECPAFARDCEAKGLKYSNVMPSQNDPTSGMGRSWQSTLRASTPEQAEDRLKALGYSWTWLADGCLRATTPVLPAVRTLPDGRTSFFNQLIAAFQGWKDERNDPSKAITFGDGTPLDREAVERGDPARRGTELQHPVAAGRRGAGRQLRHDARPPPVHRHAQGAGLAGRRGVGLPLKGQPPRSDHIDSSAGRWHRRLERSGRGLRMDIETVPVPLRERRGPEATGGLLHVLELSHREWRADVIAVCTERFERRLVEEVAGLRVQIAQTEAVLRRDMSEMKADIRQEMAQMGADIRQEMAQMGGNIRQEIATGRVEMVKWCFLFWIGQLVTIVSSAGIMLRLVR